MAKNGNSATLDVTSAIESANAARTQAIESLQSARQQMISDMEGLAGQLRQADDLLESYGVDNFTAPDLDQIGYLWDSGEVAAPRRTRKSSGGAKASASGTTRGRGGGNTTLPLGVLVTMNAQPRNTEFSIDEILAGVQEAPVSYQFAGEDSSAKSSVNVALGGLVKEGMLERAGRGVYRLTTEGSKAARGALKDMQASA